MSPALIEQQRRVRPARRDFDAFVEIPLKRAGAKWGRGLNGDVYDFMHLLDTYICYGKNHGTKSGDMETSQENSGMNC